MAVAPTESGSSSEGERRQHRPSAAVAQTESGCNTDRGVSRPTESGGNTDKDRRQREQPESGGTSGSAATELWTAVAAAVARARRQKRERGDGAVECGSGTAVSNSGVVENGAGGGSRAAADTLGESSVDGCGRVRRG